jgi:hypothetical protein
MISISTSSAQAIQNHQISEVFTNLDLCYHRHEVVILLLWLVDFELRTSPHKIMYLNVIKLVIDVDL